MYAQTAPNNHFELMLCILRRCTGVTLCIMEHTVEASEARWIADPFIDQLRFVLPPTDVVTVLRQ